VVFAGAISNVVNLNIIETNTMTCTDTCVSPTILPSSYYEFNYVQVYNIILKAWPSTLGPTGIIEVVFFRIIWW